MTSLPCLDNVMHFECGIMTQFHNWSNSLHPQGGSTDSDKWNSIKEF